MEWTVDNEDILLQVRSSYSKRPGTLFVTSKRVAWYQSTARAPQLSLPLAVLKGAPRRNKTGEAHLLKFVPAAPIKEQADFNFQFETAADRDGVQEVVAKLVLIAPLSQQLTAAAASATAPAAAAAAGAAPAPKKWESAPARQIREATAAGGEARRRAAALAGDAELRAVHEELVKSGVVAEEEFWALRGAELDKQRAQVAAQQETGMPSALVGDVRPTLVRPGELHYRLTAPMIRQIFAERPAVRRAYQDNVPHKRSEEEFWREYLQSRYVEAAGPRAKAATAGDIFAQAEAELEADRAKQPATRALLATSLDVRPGEGEPEVEDLDCEEPATVASGHVQAAAEAVVSRLNRHSTLVLEHAAAPVEDTGEIADLMPKHLPSAHVLHLHAPFKTTALDEAGGPMDLSGDNEAVANHAVSAEEYAAFVGGLKEALPQAQAAVWKSFSFVEHLEGDREAEKQQAAMAASVAGMSDETMRLWNRAHELLRHYWGCFPISSPRTARKACQMRDALAELRPKMVAEPVASSLRPAVETALKHATRMTSK